MVRFVEEEKAVEILAKAKNLNGKSSVRIDPDLTKGQREELNRLWKIAKERSEGLDKSMCWIVVGPKTLPYLKKIKNERVRLPEGCVPSPDSKLQYY